MARNRSHANPSRPWAHPWHAGCLPPLSPPVSLPLPGELALLRPEIGEQHPHHDDPPLVHSLCGSMLGRVPSLGWARRRQGELRSEAVCPCPP